MQIRDDWNHYTYTYGENQPARVAFDVGAAVFSESRFPHGLRVVVEGTDAADAALQALEGIEGLLVGRLSYAGREELVVQLADGAVKPAMAALADSEAVLEKTDGWAYFDDRVCPTPADWRRIQDREKLAELDLDGDGEVRVLHRFFGDEERLAAILARLEPEGFEKVSHDGDRLALAHHHPLDDISRITIGLMRLSEHHGALYDGWILPG